MPYYVYILESDLDGTYYVGSTRDIGERLARHNERRARYTKSRFPWKLIFAEQHPDRSSAVKREREIKSKKDRGSIERLVRTSRRAYQARREGRPDRRPRRPRQQYQGLRRNSKSLFFLVSKIPSTIPNTYDGNLGKYLTAFFGTHEGLELPSTLLPSI
jgi:putative endonuclease